MENPYETPTVTDFVTSENYDSALFMCSKCQRTFSLQIEKGKTLTDIFDFLKIEGCMYCREKSAEPGQIHMIDITKKETDHVTDLALQGLIKYVAF